MIRIAGLKKSYGPVEALRGIDFEVNAGETFGVIGPNGAGKTTLLKVLLGLVRQDGGELIIDGLSMDSDPIELKARIGYVPQRDGFEENATGREALTFLARLRGTETSSVGKMARQVGVEDLLDREIGTLSGGQRQRLSLAAALLGDPPLLLLDEPTASLDPRATVDFRDLISRMAGEGRTILLCSHLLDDVERLCDRVLVLLEGQVAAIEKIHPEDRRPSALESRFLAALEKENHDSRI